ncbi:MAG: flagellar protein FlaG [Mariprofundaceae bacterium]
MAAVVAITTAMPGLPSVEAHPVPAGRPEVAALSPVGTPQTGDPSGKNGQPGSQEVRKAVRQANIDLAGANQRIGFTYEEKLGQIFVQVMDKHTGKVIKEIPPKEFIRHQVAMREFLGMLLDRKV